MNVIANQIKELSALFSIESSSFINKLNDNQTDLIDRIDLLKNIFQSQMSYQVKII